MGVQIAALTDESANDALITVRSNAKRWLQVRMVDMRYDGRIVVEQ